MAAGVSVPVSGGEIVVLGGWDGLPGLPRSAPGSQSSSRFRPAASAGVLNAVSCLPLLPPSPAFHLPRTAAGVSTGLACLRATPTAPPDHGCWSQEWAIETTEAHRICKPLFGSQRIKSQQWGASWEFAPAACKSPRVQAAQLGRQGLPRQPQSTPTKGASGSKNTMVDMADHWQKGNKEGMAA